ncbi:ABC transporter substrate-binding protein [Patescibacteria group bacterium]|nr:ABC transporter substrate-binding protein [Patescibacteria group bacterium]
MTYLSRLRKQLRRIFFWHKPNNSQSDEHASDTFEDHSLVISVTRPTGIPTWRQLKYIGRILDLKERRLLYLILFFSFIFLAVSGILLASQHLATVPAAGGSYTEALIGEPIAINPVDAPANPTDADLVSLIYSGLFKFNNLEIVPDLAESYSWSEDNKTLTIKLRQDAYFHHGRALIADDILFTVEAIQDKSRNSLLAPLFRGVTASAVDSHTVQFTLSRADSTFIYALTVGIMPAELWQDIPAASVRLSNINFKPIGTGPYKVKTITHDNHGQIKSYTLELSDNYYGIKPNIKNLTFQFYPDTTSAKKALKSDLVDGLAFLTPLETEEFKSTARWHSIPLQIPQQTIAFFNVKDATLEDARIRQALTLAINRQEIVDALSGHAGIADTPYPFIESPSSTITDLDTARKILDGANWIIPENDNIRIKKSTGDSSASSTSPISTPSSTQLVLTITTPDQPDLKNIAEVLKRQWSLLGIKTEIEVLDTQEVLRKASRDRDGQVILFNVLLNPDQDLFPIWWSSQAGDRGTNFSGLADKDIDTLIDQTKSTTSTEILIETRAKLSTAIMDKFPAGFLVRPYYGYTISTRVKGVPQEMKITKPSGRFGDIANWYIKTGWIWK